MGRIQAPNELGRIQDAGEFQRYVSRIILDIYNVINGQIDFGQNLRTQRIEHAFSQTNVEYAIPHFLGRVPSGYLVVGKTAAADVYDGSTSWTDRVIYLKASAAATIRLEVF